MGTNFSDMLGTLAKLNATARRRSLTEVASLVHLSPGRAQRVFTALVGESPGSYQRRVALDRAATTLATSDIAITDIAFANGFGSHEAFTRAFGNRFGVSPRGYRKRVAGGWDTDDLARAAATSPCVGLYRHPLTNPPSKKHQETSVTDETNHEIATKQRDPTPVLFMSRRVDKDNLAEALAELLPAVFQYVMEQGLPMAGPPYVRYMDQSAAFLSIEAGIPLAESPKPPDHESAIEVGELPGGTVAVTIHRGPYETLGDGHMALDRWMAENGRAAAGPPWEVYLTDPGEVPDPNDWQTEILWPIQ